MSEESPVLRLQALDAQADRLARERVELPERAELAACEAEAAALAAARVEAEARRAAEAADERRLEGEVADVDAKAKRVEEELYSGRVSASKELASLQVELEMLRRRQGELEAQEMVILEAVEAADAELAEIDGRRAEVAARSEALRAAVAGHEERIDVTLAGLAEERSGRLAAVPLAVARAYERLRTSPAFGGIVTARLEGRLCRGCQTTFSMTEAGRAQKTAADEPVHCPRCNRLLVV